MYAVVINGHTAAETTWVLGTHTSREAAQAQAEQEERTAYLLGLHQAPGVHVEDLRPAGAGCHECGQLGTRTVHVGAYQVPSCDDHEAIVARVVRLQLAAH